MRIFTELSATLIFLLSFFGLSQVSICEPRSAPNPTVCSVVREAKDERALLNVEHRWAQALEQRDSAAIECLLAPEFVDIDANGELHDRAHVIGAVVNRKPWLNHLEDMRVTLGENAAVVHGLNRVTDQRSKELARVRFTDVFFYGNGQWKAISSHETLAHSAVGSKQSATHSSVIHESLQDTWWTGPLLAPSAATLPRGHFLIEPYLYGHNGKIRVAGYDIPGAISTRTTSAIHLNYDSSDAFSLAPAIEYNLNRKLGFLVGVRVIPAGRNMADTITPAVAINFVH